METIEKRGGQYYYGDVRCRDVGDAYKRFRDDYNRELGKRVYRRLDKAGRKERIHGFGFIFDRKLELEAGWAGGKRVPYRIIGLVDISYCRIAGCWDFPDVDDELFWRWFDWAFSRGSGVLRLVGKDYKAGRTSKRLKARYK